MRSIVVVLAAVFLVEFSVSQPYTVLRLVQSTYSIGQAQFPYKLKVEYHSGPQWREINGVGCLFISKDDPTYRVILANELSEPTTMHPHGLTSTMHLDGVSFVSQPPILPGRSQRFEFDLEAHEQGTYFLHAHYGFHHVDGLSVPLIIQGVAPLGYPQAELINHAKDAVMFIEDYCGLVYEKGMNHNKYCNDTMGVYETLVDWWARVEPTYDMTLCRAPLRIMDMEFRYHLTNDRPLSDPSFVRCDPGEAVRLRIISSSSFMNFRLDFGDLNVTVISSDGQWTVPTNLNQKWNVDDTLPNTLWVCPAQRYDVLIVAPTQPGVYLIKAIVGGTYHQQTGMLLIVGEDTVVPPAGTFSDSHNNSHIWMWQEPEFEAWFALPDRPVDREFTFNITGSNGFRAINEYSWKRPPIIPEPYIPNPYPMIVNYGERVCININNFSPWAHPMHLHGHSFQVTSVKHGSVGIGKIVKGAVRDTIQSTKGCGTTRICFDAFNPGTWLLHCHKDLHAAAGMVTTIEYSQNMSENLGPFINSVDVGYPDWGKRKVYQVSDGSTVKIPREDWLQLSSAADGKTTPGPREEMPQQSGGSSSMVAWFFVAVVIVALTTSGTIFVLSRRSERMLLNDENAMMLKKKDSGNLLKMVGVILLLGAAVALAVAILYNSMGSVKSHPAAPSGTTDVSSSAEHLLIPKEVIDIHPAILKILRSPSSSAARSALLHVVCNFQPLEKILERMKVTSTEQVLPFFFNGLNALSVPSLLDMFALTAGAEDEWTPESRPLLEAYRQRFGFPFILSKGDPKTSLESRLGHLLPLEMQTTMVQVAHILHQRLVQQDIAEWTNSSNATTTTTTTANPFTVITTHVLDVERGNPGSGIRVALLRLSEEENEWMTLATAITETTGRASFAHANPKVTFGTYKIVFETGEYFHSYGINAFFPRIEITFEVESGVPHYHVPCIVAPFSFQTYKGQ